MRAFLGGLVAAVLVAAAPQAAIAAGWGPPTRIAPAGYPAGVGIDAAGTTTVLYYDASLSWFLVTRPAGQQAFGAPIPVAPKGSFVRLAVSPLGQVIVIYQDCGMCTGKLWYRTGPSAAALSAPVLLGERAYVFPKLVVGPAGHAVASWSDQDASYVATMAPGRPFGAPQPRGEGANEVSVAVNGRGDAVAAWEKSGMAKASFSPAGGAFGPVEQLGPGTVPANGTAVDPGGTATVLVSRYGPLLAATRAPGSGFGPPAHIGEGHWGKLIPNHAGPAVAMWTTIAAEGDWRESSARTLHLANQRPDGTFAPSRALGSIAAATDPLSRLDAAGNLVTVFGAGRFGSGPLHGAVLSRFDLTPSEVTPALTGEYVSEPADIALGPQGRVAVVFGGFPSFSGDNAPGPVQLLERQADAVAPAVALTTAARRGGRLAARVRCSESCQVRASLISYVSKPRRRARRSASSKSKPIASRPIVLRGSRRGRVALVMPRAERTRLRGLLRRRRSVRTVLSIRAEDAWGNPRTVSRRVSAKRLLR